LTQPLDPVERSQPLRTVGIILACGDGQHSAATLLAPLAGRPVLEHSIAAFGAAPPIDELLVVVPPGLAAPAGQLLAAGGYRTPARVIETSGTIPQATEQILRTLDPDCNVLIHDAARPLISVRVIEDCVAALAAHEAVCAAVPASDTMVAIEKDHISERTQRDRLRRRQSPQGFRLPVLRRACELARADPAFDPADVCAAVLRYLPEIPVRLIPGSEQSFPVATPLDLDIAETLLRAQLP
jgi:ribitol-5-phosphate 2-dehydrogenase (NADP+) / D-ribitol-5-phosphate cytidylyltransferase